MRQPPENCRTDSDSRVGIADFQLVQGFGNQGVVMGLVGAGEGGLPLTKAVIAIQHEVQCAALQGFDFLLHVGDAPAGGHQTITGIHTDLATQQGEQRRLAAAIAPRETDMPAGVQCEVGVGQQALIAAIEGDGFELDHGQPQAMGGARPIVRGGP